MSTKHISTTPMKLGQDLISLGLKIQKREVPMSFVLNRIDASVLNVASNIPDWEKDITLVDRISALMEIQSMTQSDIAKKLKVSRQFISEIFNGKKTLSDKTAKKIIVALGAKPSTIMRIR